MMTSLNTPLVSVVVPCYNHAHFLGEAIESVLVQTYRPCEIIVIDDGSMDHTADVAASYPDVRYVRQDNQGLAAARNTGLDHSQGDYLVFLDADDRLLPAALEYGVDYLNTSPECAFVSGHYRRVASDGSVLPTWREQRIGSNHCFISGDYELIAPAGSVLNTRRRQRVASDHYAALLQRNYIGVHATVMYRRTVFERIGGFDTSLPACEDYDIYLRIARRFPIACHDHVVADYRQHKANMTRDSALMLNSALRVLHAQWGYVRGNVSYEQSYKLGEKLWYDFYFMQALGETRAHLRALAWKQAFRSAKLPVRYALMRAEEAWLKTRGFIGYRLKATWNRLTRLPIGRVEFGDLRQTIPINESVNLNSSRAIDDYYIEAFLSGYSSEIQGNVLEIGDNFYAKKYGAGQISQYDTLTVPNGDEDAVLEQVADFPANGFDCIILPQTLRIVYHAKSFLEAIYRLLKPGGVLLATLPGIGQLQSQDQANRQYWAFTTQAARRLFVGIFTPINVRVQAFGNVLAATALLQGVPVGALQPHELDHQDDQYQVLIAVRAVKPTHS